MFDFLFRNKIITAQKSNKRIKKFLSFDAMRNILILFNIKDWPDIINIIQDLEKNGKNIILWTVYNKNDFNIRLPKKVYVIDLSKEKSWKKAFSIPRVEEFNSLSYDTLIDLTTIQDETLDYLLALNKSNFSIGIKEHDIYKYDFIIVKKDEYSIEETYGQIKHYLGHIK